MIFGVGEDLVVIPAAGEIVVTATAQVMGEVRAQAGTIAINGEDLKTRKFEQVSERYNEVFADQAEVGQPLKLTYLRDGDEATVDVTPVNACQFTVVYTGKPIPTTTQGTMLLLGNAIDNYADNPLEIRTYVSRYLARIILDHRGQNQKQERKFDLLSGAAGLLTGH